MDNFIEHNYRDGESFVSWSLIDEAGQPVPVGAVLTSDHRTFQATGGKPPHHAASSGRIYGEWLDTDTSGEYFPHVFDCRWLRVDKALDLPQPVNHRENTKAKRLQFHLQFMGVMGMAGREDERDKHYIKAQEIAQQLIEEGC